MKLRFFSILIVPFLFFVVALGTIYDYGISWDEPIHFQRGQAYLHYILTGETDYDKKDVKSHYQDNQLTAAYFLEKDDGHPPLNGILASISNFIFYQKLGVLGDVESYHLFNVAASTLLVLIVVIFAWQTYGLLSSIVAGLVIASYPLFFAESHFNIKDPAQAAFTTLTIWAFWNSLFRGSSRWLLLAVVGSGLSLGTKFNILFLPLIIFPYLIVRYSTYLKIGLISRSKIVAKIPKNYLLVLLISPLVIFGLLFLTWPFLWEDPLVNFLSIVRWYKDIGTGSATYGYFVSGGFNLYAPIWIIFTTPPFVIVLIAIGIASSVFKIKQYGWAPLLWLIWFSVPILRVIAPNTTIYGGVRQIMEFLPAMSLLGGLGAYVIWNYLSNRFYINKVGIAIIILLGFLPHFYTMVKLHPNQNVYFNSLLRTCSPDSCSLANIGIGGLPAAKEKNIPYWGNSFGNAYWQIVQWLNEFASSGSKLALIQGTTVNIPRIKLREDLRFSNSYWSGIYRDGEYLIELTYNDKRYYPYAWEYVERFLTPVYEVNVDGVAIAKVWKNDLENTKIELRKREVVLSNLKNLRTQDDAITVDMGKKVLLTRLVILHPRKECQLANASVSTSVSGEKWLYEEESIPANQLVYRDEINPDQQAFFFSAKEARYIRLDSIKNGQCLFSGLSTFKVFVLEE